jgi:hypothetical protein
MPAPAGPAWRPVRRIHRRTAGSFTWRPAGRIHYNGSMKERRESLIPIPPDWKPEIMARVIEREVEKWWDEGWVFLRADTDKLMESVCLYFERRIILEGEEDLIGR